MLIVLYIIKWTIFILLWKKSQHKTRIAITNISIHILYSSILLYALAFHSSGGSSLLWYFYLALCLGLHALINLGLVIMRRKGK